MSGFTPDKEIVVLSDTRKEFDLESIYNQITDGFTLEDKGVAKLVIPEDRAPKTIITTNYTIDVSARSDRRRLWFVPINTFYGEQEELTGKTPADFTEDTFSTNTSGMRRWGAFYTTCVHCLDQYLKHGIQKFMDNVLQKRQLLKVVYRNQTILKEITTFIKEVDKNGGEVSK